MPAARTACARAPPSSPVASCRHGPGAGASRGGPSCAAAAGGHCKGVIEKEVAKIAGVATVSADPTSKDVVVCSLPAPRAVNLAAQDARVSGARGGVG